MEEECPIGLLVDVSVPVKEKPEVKVTSIQKKEAPSEPEVVSLTPEGAREAAEECSLENEIEPFKTEDTSDDDLKFIEDEEFDFDFYLSPPTSTDSDSAEAAKNENEDDDEVFFGPVGFAEKCRAKAVIDDYEEDRAFKSLRKEEVDQLLKEAYTVAYYITAAKKDDGTNKDTKKHVVCSPLAFPLPATPKESTQLTVDNSDSKQFGTGSLLKVLESTDTGSFLKQPNATESKLKRAGSMRTQLKPPVKRSLNQTDCSPDLNTTKQATSGGKQLCRQGSIRRRSGIPSSDSKLNTTKQATSGGKQLCKQGSIRRRSGIPSSDSKLNTIKQQPDSGSKGLSRQSSIRRSGIPGSSGATSKLTVLRPSTNKLLEPSKPKIAHKTPEGTLQPTSAGKSSTGNKRRSLPLARPALNDSVTESKPTAAKVSRQLLLRVPSKLQKPEIKSVLAQRNLLQRKPVAKTQTAAGPMRALPAKKLALVPAVPQIGKTRSSARQSLEMSTPVKQDKCVNPKHLMNSSLPVTPCRNNSDSSNGSGTPASTRSLRYSLLPTPSKSRRSIDTGRSSSNSSLDSPYVERLRSPAISKRPPVQNTPQKENLPKRSIWSPVRKRKLINPEDEFIACTKRTTHK